MATVLPHRSVGRRDAGGVARRHHDHVPGRHVRHGIGDLEPILVDVQAGHDDVAATGGEIRHDPLERAAVDVERQSQGGRDGPSRVDVEADRLVRVGDVSRREVLHRRVLDVDAVRQGPRNDRGRRGQRAGRGRSAGRRRDPPGAAEAGAAEASWADTVAAVPMTSAAVTSSEPAAVMRECIRPSSFRPRRRRRDPSSNVGVRLAQAGAACPACTTRRRASARS